MAEYILKCSPILETDGTPLEVVGELIRCRDCKYFELNHVDMVNFPTEAGNAESVPIITAHEICTKWGDGCKTSIDGYCFMAERKEE